MLPGLGGLAWLLVLPEFDPYKYNSFTTNAGEQVHRLTRSVAGRIESRARSHPTRVLPPTLVIKSNADATVSTDAVVDRLLGLLDPHRHELVLFDINRFAAKSILLVADPRALTNRVVGDGRLPFAVTLVTNESPESPTVVARRQEPFSAEMSQTEPLGLAWPAGVISLSHVALAFPAGRPSLRPAPSRERRRPLSRADGHSGRAGLAHTPVRVAAAHTAQPVLCVPGGAGAGVDGSRRWVWKRRHGIVNPRRAGRWGHPAQAIKERRPCLSSGLSLLSLTFFYVQVALLGIPGALSACIVHRESRSLSTNSNQQRRLSWVNWS